MDGVIHRSFNINFKILRLLGLYPSENPSRLYLSYGYCLLTFCLVLDPVISSLHYIKDKNSNVMEAGFSLFLLVVMVCFIPKHLPLLINYKKIQDCFKFLETINISLNKQQSEIIEDCVKICRRNSIFFFSCVVADSSSWTSRPLFSKNRELPMDVWLPFDATSNLFLFYVVYFAIAIGVIYSGFTSAAIDPLIGGLAYHAAAQVKLLKNNLLFLNDYVKEEMSRKKFHIEGVNNASLKAQLIFKHVTTCIEHHNAILIFVKKIENCFSVVVVSQFLGSIVIIGLCCLHLSKLSIGGLNFFLMLIYLISALLQIYFYCYYGTMLYEENETLATAAYMSHWQEYNVKTKKALIMLMQRSNRPMTIIAGKIFDLSLDTFTMILRRSYSLLAVLRNY